MVNEPRGRSGGRNLILLCHYRTRAIKKNIAENKINVCIDDYIEFIADTIKEALNYCDERYQTERNHKRENLVISKRIN
jgi:hypothetical protein